MPNLPKPRFGRPVRSRGRVAGPAEAEVEAPNVEIVEAEGLRWIHIERPRPADRTWLEEHFEFHHLDYEDVFSRNQRPKIDEYPDYLFIVLHFPLFDKQVGRLNAAELDIFVGPDFIITLPNQPLKPVEYLFERCRTNEEVREQLFSKGTGYLLYKIVDECVDACFPMLAKMGNKLEQLEEEIFDGRGEEIVRDISNVKQEIINFRKIVRPQRAALHDLERTKRYMREELEVYFDDIVDASERIWDMLENYKEVVEALESTNESVLSHRVNDILRVLTSFSVIVLPLTFIASLWGMNVGLPGEGDKTAFWIIAGACVAILVGMVAYSSAGVGGCERARGAHSSAARDRRQDRQLAAVGNRGLQAVEEADVLAAEVDVDEAAQIAVRVEAIAQIAVACERRTPARRRPWRPRPGWTRRRRRRRAAASVA